MFIRKEEKLGKAAIYDFVDMSKVVSAPLSL